MVYTPENSWPTVNQEGEYILNAIKAFGFYETVIFFWREEYFFITQYGCLLSSSDVSSNGKVFYYFVTFVCFFFIDCEICRTILNTVIFLKAL